VANAKVERIVGTSSLLPLEAGDVKYYNFSQNNSGGRFHVDDNVAENVIIAARTVDEANERAEKVSIYFAGCAAGRDCNCCGDRWSSQRSESKDVEPLVYSSRPENHLIKHGYSMRSKVIIYHADGSRETFARVEE